MNSSTSHTLVKWARWALRTPRTTGLRVRRPASEGQPARDRLSGDGLGPAKNEQRTSSQPAGSLLVVLVPRTQSSVTARVCARQAESTSADRQSRTVQDSKVR